MTTYFQLSPLYPILDASTLPAGRAARDSFLSSLVAELIEAGVTLLQYRNKQGTDDEIVADARVLRANTASDRLVLILNDRPDLLSATGLDGVHIGQEDVSPSKARALIGPARILGVSTHNASQLRIADAEPADYLAIGPVFATTTKLNPDPVIGLEGVQMARSLTRKPLVAIGGITLERAADTFRAGADSLAVARDLIASSDPAGRAREFLGEASRFRRLPGAPD
jgi:thiamine-phosphate pyrophosphorylase